MKFAIVPIQTLMQPHETIVAYCESGVYVAKLLCGIIGERHWTVRLIPYYPDRKKNTQYNEKEAKNK